MKTFEKVSFTPTAQILAEMAAQLVGIIQYRKLIDFCDLSQNLFTYALSQDLSGKSILMIC